MSTEHDSTPTSPLKLRLDAAFQRELPGLPEPVTSSRQTPGVAWAAARPMPVRAPSLLALVPSVATLTELDAAADSNALAATLSGNQLFPGTTPYAACYGGHQFGNWAGQLGDGRAMTIAEGVNRAGERVELQLKGAGPTAYSRRADGRAVLRSSVRELLCSEAMHALGVPTTRALSLVLTGDRVERDMFYDGNPELEPGAIVCRVAPSFIRFGNFELPAARAETDLLARLVDFTMARDFGLDVSRGDRVERIASWFSDVCARTATLLIHWMRVGFVHGVMNTDNMSILGLTLDYGPYGFLEDFDPTFTPNTTDAQGRRYRFGAQPNIAAWNLSRLARALTPLLPDAALLDAGLERYISTYESGAAAMFQRKLGLSTSEPEDDQLLADLFPLLQRGELDYTLFFRGLADVDPELKSDPLSLAPLAEAFYKPEARSATEPALLDWLTRYTARVRREPTDLQATRASRMNAVNPSFILRNYLAQQASDAAALGDLAPLNRLLETLKAPYVERSALGELGNRRPEWARHKAGCSMLSCSS